MSSISDTGGNEENRDFSDVSDAETAERSSLEERISLSTNSLRESRLDRSTRDHHSSNQEAPGSEEECAPGDLVGYEVRYVKDVTSDTLQMLRSAALSWFPAFTAGAMKVWTSGVWGALVRPQIVTITTLLPLLARPRLHPPSATPQEGS